MRPTSLYLLGFLLLCAGLLSGCPSSRNERPSTTTHPIATAHAPTGNSVEPTPTSSPAGQEEAAPLHLVLLWHHHQPFYLKNADSNNYRQPWVRLHATRDYVDLAALLLDYPDIRATFNLTPPLLQQLEDFGSGARDRYWEHTIIPADTLTEEQKAFIRTHFFDNRPGIIEQFPRYQALADRREESDRWDDQAWRDLQILFNLSWIDPTLRQNGPLATLVEKGRNYSEQDKAVVLEEHLRLLSEVIPLHRRLQEQGQIEIPAGPLYHPILPLLADSDIARQTDPGVDLPRRFSYPEDVAGQLERGNDYYRDLFGQDPAGLWPPGGAISEGVMAPLAESGIRWVAADENVLAGALGEAGFKRQAHDLPPEPERLYRPYRFEPQSGDDLYLFFRDRVLSEKITGIYREMGGEAAGQDFVEQLLAIRRQLQERGEPGPFVVTVVVDDWKRWADDPDGGKGFLRSLYRQLRAEQERGRIQTITPAEFVERYPNQPALDRLPPGRGQASTLQPWIGDATRNRAWNFLRHARTFLQAEAPHLDDDERAAAFEQMYAAEGSDWFRRFATQGEQHENLYDYYFRQRLKRVYEAAGTTPPRFLDVPLRPPTPVSPSVRATAPVSPTIDGVGAESEWQGSGYFPVEERAEPKALPQVTRIWYGFGETHLYLRLDVEQSWAALPGMLQVGFYLAGPDESEQFFSRIPGDDTPLGFGARALAEVTIQEDGASGALYLVDQENRYDRAGSLVATAGERSLEVAIPYEQLSLPDQEGSLRLRVLLSEKDGAHLRRLPVEGAAEIPPP